MIEPEAPRPDPDELLRRVQEAESSAGHGRLRIFFGFAPGVGKTYRMLQVARDLLLNQGKDLVVGVVETHGRSETGALLEGLPEVPRRVVEYRGRALSELDLDRVLTRHPEVIIVDELAHTNAPGSRHPKRWQDVLEILEAGIDVLTTLNVQHIESLNDVIARITKVQVRETVPDSILERAEAVELVDIAPEELLARLKEGKVYLPDQALRAAEHFFQRGNLLALRELALRRMAEHVDEDVRQYRTEHGIRATWAVGERILVCVGPAPSSAKVIRAAARTAAGLRCPWVALYVEATTLGTLGEEDHTRLDAHLRLAQSLGATVARVPAVRTADAVLDYARTHNVTRILIGKPTHSRLIDRLRGSLLDDIVRGSGEIEIHVIQGDEIDQRGDRRPRDGIAVAPKKNALALGLVLLTTGLAAVLETLFAVPDPEMLYILAVMVAAIRLGRAPSLLAAALSVAAYDFFFVPPRYNFAVGDTQYLLTFVMLFGVGLLVSELTSRLRRQEQAALAHAAETSTLYTFSRELGAATQSSEIIETFARRIVMVFGQQALVLIPSGRGELSLAFAVPEDPRLDEKELSVARWCFEHGRPAGLGTDTLPGASVLCCPLSSGAAPVGVLALRPPAGRPLDLEARDLLDALAQQASLALDRTLLADETRQVALKAKTEELRSSLLSAVSHDLRTPLAAITGAATTLLDDAELPETTRKELLISVADEAERLERLVTNLLDMTRLESGDIQLQRDWVPIEEVLGPALSRVEGQLEPRTVELEIPADLPLLPVDPVLFELVFVNLLENVSKYTPPTSHVWIAAGTSGSKTWIEVADDGPGVEPGDEERIFEKFFRGAASSRRGAGLGLAICRGIVAAHGGEIHARSRAGGGLVFRIELPQFEKVEAA